MATCSRGQIVLVPFPYTDRNTRQRRPALVISDGALGQGGTLLWVLMITSADHQSWPGDIDLTDASRSTGLQAPSIVRTAKIATVEAREADPIGRVSPALLKTVEGELRRSLAL